MLLLCSESTATIHMSKFNPANAVFHGGCWHNILLLAYYARMKVGEAIRVFFIRDVSNNLLTFAKDQTALLARRGKNNRKGCYLKSGLGRTRYQETHLSGRPCDAVEECAPFRVKILKVFTLKLKCISYIDRSLT